MRNIIFTLTLMICLNACSAAMVSKQDDPYKKLNQAKHLMSINRPIPAEKISKEALNDFEMRGDQLGQARAHNVLGQFYIAKALWENTPRDLYAEKAVTHFTEAKKKLVSINEYMWASSESYNIAQIHRGEGNQALACQEYKESLKLYSSGKGQKVFPSQPSEKFEKQIKNSIKSVCQSSK